jgi:hypothetical protein
MCFFFGQGERTHSTKLVLFSLLYNYYVEEYTYYVRAHTHAHTHTQARARAHIKI